MEEGSIQEGLTASLDRARVIEALTKLVAVALKSTGEGGVIRLGAEKHDGAVAFTIYGVAPRATKNVAPDENRGGLAMLIARGILAAHGASLATVTRPLEGGSRTLVLFPSA